VEDQKDKYFIFYILIYIYMKNNKQKRTKRNIKKKGKGFFSIKIPPVNIPDIEISKTPNQIERDHKKALRRYDRTIKSRLREEERVSIRTERASESSDFLLSSFKRRFEDYKSRKNLGTKLEKLKQLHLDCKKSRFKDDDRIIELAKTIQENINKLEGKNIAGKKKSFKKRGKGMAVSK
tara:strand:- start:68 stop:604 length:537 start_codon:yes stop_codon:yes gene_type:complete